MTHETKNQVPCNGCRRCCIGDAVRILPHENAENWLTEPHFKMPDARMLAHKANGECVYLGQHGCDIHGSAPQQCRDMDCRNIARAFTFTQIRKMNINMSIWHRGKELLRR